jgi:hypothetical protein
MGEARIGKLRGRGGSRLREAEEQGHGVREGWNVVGEWRARHGLRRATATMRLAAVEQVRLIEVHRGFIARSSVHR